MSQLLDALVKARSRTSSDVIPRRGQRGSAPLSYGQQRMWVLSQLLDDGAGLNLVTAVRLRGPLNLPALRQGFDDVARRHEVLRSVISFRDGSPVQSLGPHRHVPLRFVELTGLPTTWRRRRVDELLHQEARHPFDLRRGPLVRVTVAAVGPREHLVAVAMHHMVTDDWSLGLLARELAALYAAYLTGRPCPLSGTPPLQYADFARWQHAEQREFDSSLSFWTEQLHDPPDGELPFGRRASEPRRTAATWTCALAPSLTARLRQLQRREGGSLFMLVVAALATLIHRLDGRLDVALGTLAAGRTRPELEALLGFFVNVLVIRARYHDEPTFRDLWRRVREYCIAGYVHQDVPYEKLLERLRPRRDASAAPLVHVVCVAQQPAPPLNLAGLEAEPVDVAHDTAQFDLVVEVRERADTLHLAFTYDTDVLREEAGPLLGRYLRTLLGGAAANPDAKCDELPLDADALPRVQPSRPHRTAEACLHELFEEQAARTPDAVALSHRGRSLTYRCLNERSNRLARYLRACGVGAEDVVGVCLDRSLESTIALLAVMKAGGAYVPLDPSYPPERLVYMLADSSARCVITASDLLDRLVERDPAISRPVLVDREAVAIAHQPGSNLNLPLSPESPAYVVYTSGTTGRPKGVVGLHRGAVNRFRWMWRSYPFGPGERVCHRTALSFVDSVWEVFGPLLRGVPAEVLDPDVVADPGLLVDSLARAQVTRIVVVPALLRMMFDAASDLDRQIPALRFWVTSGERLPAELAARFHAALPGRALLNLYGSSEVSADATAAEVEPGRRDAAAPIGRPIDAITASVRDPRGLPVPALVTGELYLAGDGLARGYHRRPGETAARFLPDPDGPAGSRTFRSGDLVRAQPDGALEFLGRVDDQVQIRGYRVEPGEIEEALLRHPAVVQAAVVAADDAGGSTVLVGYVVLAAHGTAAELRAFLSGALPAHLVPSVLVAVDALPYTPSGKVDRRRLPPPDTAAAVPDADALPATPAEEMVAAVFADLLPVRWRGVHDDFFGLGGHSILAAAAVHRLSGRCGAQVGLRDLFAAPTIAGLARLVEERAGGDPSPAASSVSPRPTARPAEWYEPFPLTEVQQAYWIGRDPDLELGDIATHAYFEVETESLDVHRLTAAVRQLVERHHALRTVVRPDGTQQVLREVPPYQIEARDLRHVTPEVADRRLAETRERLSHQVLRADSWPLFEIAVSLLAGGRARIHVSIDALIADAYSVQLLLQELGELYRCPETRLAPLELTFRDCVVAGLAVRETDEYRRALAYWRGRVAELPPGPELPLAHDPDSLGAPRFRRWSHRLASTTWDRLAEGAAAAGLTASGLLLAAFCEVLTTWSRRPHYTLTLTLFNRLVDHPQVDRVVGDFTSLVLLEVDHRADDTFLARAKKLQARLWEDLDHRAVSGVTVMREWTRQRGGTPRLIAPVVFTSNLELGVDTGGAAEGLGSLGYGITQTPQLYLDHQVAQTPEGLLLNWDAVADLFPPGLVDDMFEGYVGLIERLAADTGRWHEPVRDLLPATQRRRRTEANATAGPRSRACLHTLVAEAAARRGDAPAVITADRTMSYREVSVRAARVARRLRAVGVGRGQLVGIAMNKGWEQVVAVLGVTACGAAYLPLDPELPAERMRELADRTSLERVLVQSGLREHLPGLRHLARLAVDDDSEWPAGDETLDDLPDYGVEDGDLAYVIFTSGSTGTPKGVMIDHRGAVNTVLDINRRFHVGEDDRVLGLSSLSFDLSVYDIFGTLAGGGSLVLPEHNRRRDPAAWLELVAAERVTIWNSVPALMSLAAEHAGSPGGGGLASLRLAMLSGDWIPVHLPDRIRALADPIDVVSLGGATEASIWSVWYPIERVEESWTSIPYGRPLTNQRLHILDSRLVPRPDWVAGDLFIGGDGLALGYWNDQERTAQSFFTHPGTGERLYRTGDVARYRDDGDIEFLGREDLQVKVAGYRVELGEIETFLGRLPGVAAGAVAALGPPRGEKRLAAYYVPDSGATLDADMLRRLLLAKLPAYMVPSTFTPLEALPLTGNGKVDRAALADMHARPDRRRSRVAAQPDLERSLAALWAEVLGVEHVDVDDNFFQLGGTSLVAIRFLARLQVTLHIKIPLVRLYESPTVAELAAAIAEARTEGAAPRQTEASEPPAELAPDEGPALRPDPTRWHQPFPLTDIQQAYWMGRRGALQLGNVGTHSYFELDVTDLDVARLERSVQRLVERHLALRTVVQEDGWQRALATVPPYRIAHRDLRGLEPDAAQAELAAARRTMSHQVHAAHRWPLFDIRTHRLDERRTRLHVSIDLLVADALSFRILQWELSVLYQDESAALRPLGCTFRDYVLAIQHIRGGPAHARAEAYWRQRAATLPPAPPLPLVRDLAEIARPEFERLEGRLDESSWATLRRIAAGANLTPSGVLCAAFAEVLAMWSGRGSFTINLTTFNRLPLHPDVTALVGDFTSTTLLGVDATAPTFAERAGRLQQQIFRDLEHRLFGGVEVLRLLRADPRRRVDAIAPVVFTSTLMPEQDSPTLRAAGWDAQPVYSVSQTPQVLLDHQVYEHEGTLVYTWDYVAEAFPPGMIGAMFAAYGRLLHSLTSDHAYWKADPAW